MAKNVVIISGNIGAGKSTLTDYLQKREKSLCIPEFVDPSWLEHFYADRKSYTAYFEKSCLLARIARHIKAKGEIGTVFFDRGLIESREIFVQNSFDEGYLSHRELNGYDFELKEALDTRLGRTEHDSKKWLERLVVYMDAPAKLCYDRQKERAMKKGDKSEVIPLEYFDRLEERYMSFISKIDQIYKKWGLPSTPKVLRINATRDISTDKNYLEETADEIMAELGKNIKCY